MVMNSSILEKLQCEGQTAMLNFNIASLKFNAHELLRNSAVGEKCVEVEMETYELKSKWKRWSGARCIVVKRCETVRQCSIQSVATQRDNVPCETNIFTLNTGTFPLPYWTMPPLVTLFFDFRETLLTHIAKWRCVARQQDMVKRAKATDAMLKSHYQQWGHNNLRII